MRSFKFVAYILSMLFVVSGCTVQKKKGDISTMSKVYHNTTSKFNAYFNADVLMQEAYLDLGSQHQDNFNRLLPIYPFIAAPNPKTVHEKLDKAIEKVSISATIHEPSQWVDDCFVLLGEAQFLKQDYEEAEKTFEFFIDEFDPLKTRTMKLDKNKKKKRTSSASKSKRPTKKKAAPTKKKKRTPTRKKAAPAKKKKKRTTKPGSKKRTAKPGSKKRPPKEDASASKGETSTSKKETETGQSEAPKTEVKEEKKTSPLVKTVERPKDDDEIVINTTSKKGMFGHKPVYQFGILWLAKTYIVRERFPLADYYLKQLAGDDGAPVEVKAELPVVQAMFHLYRKEYNEAIAPLSKAVSLTKDKNLKARYLFIVAQLHQMNGRQADAFKAFNQVIKLHPDYEMEFNAGLNLAKASWASGQESADKIVSRLEKMAKEEKNYDFRDQIYFTIGTIYLKLKQRDLAIENFRKSVKYNVGNPIQKSESYLVLADYFYEEEEYAEAKYHYDSTLMSLPQTDERYAEIDLLTKNLKDIALNISVIQLQDSLLKVSRMSPEEQKKIAAEIKKKKELASKPKSLSPSKTVGLGAASAARPAGLTTTGKKSNFFAYDLNKVRRGQNEFRKRWGNRTLEDDWRRSNKPSRNISEDTSPEDIAKVMSEDEVQELLKDVPFSPKQKALAKAKIEEAYFKLGKLYREKMEKYKKAADAHEELLSINDNTPFKMETYYYLYLNHSDLNNISSANAYLDLLKSEFPDSKFTLSITDPTYAARQMDERKKLQRQYDQAYSMFSSGNYSESQVILAELSESDDVRIKPLMPKIDLLKAMCDGNLKGEDEYITSLNYVVKKHPNTQEEARAKEILRFVKGDKQAFDPILYNERAEDFSSEANKLHYVLLVLYSGDSKKLTSAKIDVSSYNQKHHKEERLKITSIYLNKEDNSQIILIRKFRNKEIAMDYYNGVQEKEEEFMKGDSEYEIFAVTQKSYREIVKQKSVNAYRQFFESEYITGGEE